MWTEVWAALRTLRTYRGLELCSALSIMLQLPKEEHIQNIDFIHIEVSIIRIERFDFYIVILTRYAQAGVLPG